MMVHLFLATSLSLQPVDTSRIKATLNVTPASFNEVSVVPLDSTRVLPFGDDKVRHFFTTYAAYSFSYAGGQALGMSRSRSLGAAGCAAATIAIGKEVYDQMHNKRFSGYDLIADALGGVAAFLTLKQVR